MDAMIPRRSFTHSLICAVAVSSFWTMLFGCASNNKSGQSTSNKDSEKQQVVPAAQQPDDATKHDAAPPDQMDADRGTIDALTRKVAAYTRSLDGKTANRAGTAPQQSGVEWMDPNDLRLSPYPAMGVPLPRATVQPVQSQDPPPAMQTAPLQQPQSKDYASNIMPNQPLAVAPSEGRAESKLALSPVDGLDQKLAARIKDSPHDVAAHLEFQLLQFLLNDPVPNMAAISSLPTEDRELVAAVIDGLSNFRSTVRQDNNMLLSKKIRPLLDLADRLRSQADLSLANVQLCTHVEGFAKYDPFDPARFPSGVTTEVILYSEVENFSSQLNDQKRWETKLSVDTVLYTEGGQQIWGDKTDSVVEATRTRRHDYFMAKRIKLPSSLVPGRYLLKVSVTDQQISRVAEATVPVVIVAQ
jgi:hypothetical protein